MNPAIEGIISAVVVVAGAGVASVFDLNPLVRGTPEPTQADDRAR